MHPPIEGLFDHHPSMIRPWSDHESHTPQPARSRRFRISPSRRIFAYGKAQHYGLRLSPKFSSKGAPATTSDTQTSPILHMPRKVTLQHQQRFQKARILQDFLKIDSSGSQLLLSQLHYPQLLYSQLLLLSATLTPSYYTLSYSTFDCSTFSYSNLSSSTLSYSTLSYSAFDYSTFSYSTLSSSTLSYSTFSYSTFSYFIVRVSKSLISEVFQLNFVR